MLLDATWLHNSIVVGVNLFLGGASAVAALAPGTVISVPIVVNGVTVATVTTTTAGALAPYLAAPAGVYVLEYALTWAYVQSVCNSWVCLEAGGAPTCCVVPGTFWGSKWQCNCPRDQKIYVPVSDGMYWTNPGKNFILTWW
jgi:hypothetical protein